MRANRQQASVIRFTTRTYGSLLYFDVYYNDNRNIKSVILIGWNCIMLIIWRHCRHMKNTLENYTTITTYIPLLLCGSTAHSAALLPTLDGAGVGLYVPR